MKVVDLTEEHESEYIVCLEDWSDEARESGPKRGCWYESMKAKGLRAKLAMDDKGVVGGMIQYGPVENTWVDGRGLFFVYCIWVHGHKQGRGNFQKKGMGTALLEAAETDARSRGAKGIAAWGISLPFWMKASWFKKHGYEVADKNSVAVLLWKRFSKDANAPKWIKQRKMPVATPGKVTVTSFVNGWCMAQNLVHERAKRAAAEFGDSVLFREINTSDTDALREWGMPDALFIDDTEVSTGPPPTYEKIKKLIMKRVNRL